MKEFIDSVLDGFSNGFRFLIAVCSILLCLILHDVRHDVREIKVMDKNSFGACVVSNAENVISTKTKTYYFTTYSSRHIKAVRLVPEAFDLRGLSVFPIAQDREIHQINF